MPPRSRTLGDLLDETARARPDADAVIFRDQRLTYGALRARADELARALLAVGVRKGDRVAVLLPNRPEWLVAAFAIGKVGAITVGVSTFSAPREIAWTIEHCRPAVIITMEAFRGRSYLDPLYAACPELATSSPGELRSERLPELRAVVSIDSRRHPGVYRLGDFVGCASAVRTEALRAAQASVAASDPCYILYTSGSTATAKGVVLAHGSVVENGFNIGERQHLTAADRVWLAVPLFWSFGSANALPAIVTHGGSVVLQESFEPGEALALLDEQRCSVYYGMANMARAMLEHPDRRHRALAAMRTGLTIGLPEDIQMTMEAVAARELCNVYGSTETYGNCAVTDAHDALALRLETQGRPLPGGAPDPRRGSGEPPGTAARRRRRVSREGPRDARLLQRRRADARGLRRRGVLRHRRSRPHRRRRAGALPRTAEGDDQDGRHQRGPARGGGRAAEPFRGQTGLRGRRPRSRAGRAGGGGRRAPRRRDRVGGGAGGVLPGAARRLQGARAVRVPEGGRVPAHADREGAETEAQG